MPNLSIDKSSVHCFYGKKPACCLHLNVYEGYIKGEIESAITHVIIFNFVIIKLDQNCY